MTDNLETPLPDLDHMTIQDLTRLIYAATGKRQEKLEQAKSELLAEFRNKASQMGLTLEAILPTSTATPKKPLKAAVGTVAPKYQGPNGELWSGRGRLPVWLRDAEAGGKARREFLISEDS